VGLGAKALLSFACLEGGFVAFDSCSSKVGIKFTKEKIGYHSSN